MPKLSVFPVIRLRTGPCVRMEENEEGPTPSLPLQDQLDPPERTRPCEVEPPLAHETADEEGLLIMLWEEELEDVGDDVGR